MANNCLKTKLIGIVTNDNLPYFDVIVLFKASNTFSEAANQLRLSFTSGGTMKIIGDGSFVTAPDYSETNVKEKSFSAGNVNVIVKCNGNDDVKLLIPKKSGLITFAQAAGAANTRKSYVPDFSEFIKCKNTFMHFNTPNVATSQDINDIATPIIAQVNLKGSANVTGNIRDFAIKLIEVCGVTSSTVLITPNGVIKIDPTFQSAVSQYEHTLSINSSTEFVFTLSNGQVYTYRKVGGVWNLVTE